MSISQPFELAHDAGDLPGPVVVARIRRLVVVGVLASVAYSFLIVASRGFCPVGAAAGSGLADDAANLGATEPSCITLTLGPSAVLYVAIAAIVIGALTLVLRRATDQLAAIHYLDRAAAAIALMTIASIVIAQIWFMLIPLDDWNGTGTFFYPFPFGSVATVISPPTIP